MGALAPVVRWRLRLGWAMLVCRSKAVVLAALYWSLGGRARLAVKVSVMRNCITLPAGYRQSSPGMMRNMNSSNIGTVKAVSP